MDLYHYWGGDLSASPAGDFNVVDGQPMGVQRILRRLMTAQGELIHHPKYGAGLPQRIGLVKDTRVITAIVMSQIFRETSVSRSPRPSVTVTDFQGGVTIYIKYVDKFTGKTVQFSFPVVARPLTQSSQTDLSVEIPR